MFLSSHNREQEDIKATEEAIKEKRDKEKEARRRFIQETEEREKERTRIEEAKRLEAKKEALIQQKIKEVSSSDPWNSGFLG